MSNNIQSIKGLENLMEEKTHFKSLGLTPSNTVKYVVHSEKELVNILSTLSNNKFNKNIDNLVLINHEELSSQEDFSSELEHLIDKTLNNLNQSSNTHNAKIIIFDTSQNGQHIVIHQKNETFGLVEQLNGVAVDYSIGYYNHRYKSLIAIEAEKMDNSLSITMKFSSGNTTSLSAELAENSPHIIAGDIKILFDQVGLEFHPLA